MQSNYIVRVSGSPTYEARLRLQEIRSSLFLVHGYRDESEEQNASGNPYFRVLVQNVDSPERAEQQVEEALAGLEDLEPLEGLSVIAVDLDGGRDAIIPRYDEIHHRAVEHFLAESMQAVAAEQERVFRVHRGREANIKLLSVQLRGSFPDTILRVKTFHRVSKDQERTEERQIWKDDDFVAACENFEGLSAWISDYLMFMRGG